MEQPGEEAPRCLVAFHGFGAVLMAGAPVVRGDGSFDLIDVVAASGPRGLAADAASSCLAHQAVSLQTVLNVGGTCKGSEVRRISDCRILCDLVSCVTLGAIRSNLHLQLIANCGLAGRRPLVPLHPRHINDVGLQTWKTCAEAVRRASAV